MAGSTHLTVHNVHNGEQIKIPKPVRFVSMANLKNYLVEQFTDRIIGSAQNVFLLTSFGIKLELSVANDMNEVFLFDKQLFQKPLDQSILDRYLQRTDPQLHTMLQPEQIALPDLPKYPDIRSVSFSLERYNKWATTLAPDFRRMEERAERIARELNVIFMGINVIFNFASNFTTSAEKSFRSHYSHVKQLATKTLSKSWRAHYSILESFPEVQLNSAIRLHELIAQEELEQAAAYVSENLPSLVSAFNGFSQSMNEVNEQKLRVDTMIESLRKESSSKFKHLESQKQALKTDFEQSYADFQSDISNLNTSETEALAEIYKRQAKVCIDMLKTSQELYKILESLYEFKKRLVYESCSIFESIALQQMKSVEVRTACKSIVTPNSNPNHQSEQLTKIKSSEDFLSMTVDLPLLFGFIIIEKRRQYEWHDFYSRGIVSSVTEQLTTIIEHERAFQQLWNKKFGKLIENIHHGVSLGPSVPAIDITLVNSGKTGDANGIFAWLGALNVEREDITRYIESVKNFDSPNSAKFSTLLSKNFKDLVFSTEKLKQMTKNVSTLSASVTTESGGSQIQSLMSPAENVEQDFDLTLISGLRSRIKKLESLLHQKQYKDLNTWPVVKSSREIDEKMSLLLTESSRTAEPKESYRKSSTGSKKESETKSQSSSEKYRALEQQERALQSQFDTLKIELEAQEKQYQAELKALAEKYQQDLRKQEESAEEAKRSADENYSRIMEELEKAQKSCLALQQRNEELEKALKQEELEDEIASLNAKLSDEKIVQADLLSNLQAKESEFVQERNVMQSQLNDLQSKLDEKSDDFENLMEVVQSKQHNTDELVGSMNGAMKGLFGGMVKLMESNIAYFRDFCLVLESMGLLLVQQKTETGFEYRIKRVKGLRSKKESEESDEADQEFLRSAVVNEVQDKCKWMLTLQSGIQGESSDFLKKTGTHETEYVESEARALLSLYETYVSSGSKLDQFLNMISFKENVQFQEHDEEALQNRETFFSNGIIKRFNIVEGFAKKLTKENKTKSTELAKALKSSSEKIAVKDFQKGDLVLFLPTKIDSYEQATPWTAFNIDAPHYFLDTASFTEPVTQEYVLSRVVDVKEYVADQSNPYSLGVGTKWYSMTVDSQ